MSSRSHSIAQAIFKQHQSKLPFSALSGDLQPLDIRDAYAAQTALHALHLDHGRGAIGGRKIALASSVQQQLCGINHPIAGGIFSSEILSSPATLELQAFHGLGIEFEMAISLKEDSEVGRNYSEQEIQELIQSIHPAFEMIIDRAADYSALDPLTMIADNAWCAGIVLGDDVTDSVLDRINHIPTTLTWNGKTEQALSGASDPLGSLTWVVNLLSDMGETLKALQPVITGSVMKTRYPAAGDSIQFDFDGLAGVQLEVH